MPPFAQTELLVAFADFSRFAVESDGRNAGEVAAVMDAYYELAGSVITSAGGRVVKFIGDATLAVFPPETADRAVLALLDLKDRADQFMKDQGWSCELLVKVHYGPVAEGDFGAAGDKRYDVLGKTVNVTAKLDSSGVALSAEAFRQLGSAVRRQFTEHKPSATYGRREAPRRVN